MRKYLLSVVAVVAAVALLQSAAVAGLLSVTNNNSRDPNDVYELRLGALDNGELVQIDRSHLFANLPPEMIGIDYIKTANDDKTAGPGFSVDVTFDPGIQLFLSIDYRVGDDEESDPPDLSVMPWVATQGWTDTGWTWNKANEIDPLIPHAVYTLTPDGTSHTFYEQNDGSGRNMYSIAGVPEPSTLVMLAGVALGLLLAIRRRRTV